MEGHRRRNLPPVFTTVPVRDKVVFLTIDDGAEKDPEFLRMMSELKVPYSAFLSGYLVEEDYRYFEEMQDAGVALHNHTLRHPYMPALSCRAQTREICGMQGVIGKRYGTRPALARPTATTTGRPCAPPRPAESKHVPLEPGGLRRPLGVPRVGPETDPGDIVLTHFRGRGEWDGTMRDMVRRFLSKVTAEGYAVARLEDYL
ncbi:Peptidoglycan/xylan/chitin deacetylase (PgdA/CDA1 family) OS=Streptomyces violarus OX=67380 GN=FHS41_002797 PE=4 SV=1 [Streptomyces violarus]